MVGDGGAGLILADPKRDPVFMWNRQNWISILCVPTEFQALATGARGASIGLSFKWSPLGVRDGVCKHQKGTVPISLRPLGLLGSHAASMTMGCYRYLAGRARN